MIKPTKIVPGGRYLADVDTYTWKHTIIRQYSEGYNSGQPSFDPNLRWNPRWIWRNSADSETAKGTVYREGTTGTNWLDFWFIAPEALWIAADWLPPVIITFDADVAVSAAAPAHTI